MKWRKRRDTRGCVSTEHETKGGRNNALRVSGTAVMNSPLNDGSHGNAARAASSVASSPGASDTAFSRERKRAFPTVAFLEGRAWPPASAHAMTPVDTHWRYTAAAASCVAPPDAASAAAASSF